MFNIHVPLLVERENRFFLISLHFLLLFSYQSAEIKLFLKMNFVQMISLSPCSCLVVGSLMTTKLSQPQSTLAKSLTSTSTNAPYLKALGKVVCCYFCLLYVDPSQS